MKNRSPTPKRSQVVFRREKKKRGGGGKGGTKKKSTGIKAHTMPKETLLLLPEQHVVDYERKINVEKNSKNDLTVHSIC